MNLVFDIGSLAGAGLKYLVAAAPSDTDITSLAPGVDKSIYKVSGEVSSLAIDGRPVGRAGLFVQQSILLERCIREDDTRTVVEGAGREVVIDGLPVLVHRQQGPEGTRHFRRYEGPRGVHRGRLQIVRMHDIGMDVQCAQTNTVDHRIVGHGDHGIRLGRVIRYDAEGLCEQIERVAAHQTHGDKGNDDRRREDDPYVAQARTQRMPILTTTRAHVDEISRRLVAIGRGSKRSGERSRVAKRRFARERG